MFIYMVCVYPVNVYKYNNRTYTIVHETAVIIHDDDNTLSVRFNIWQSNVPTPPTLMTG